MQKYKVLSELECCPPAVVFPSFGSYATRERGPARLGWSTSHGIDLRAHPFHCVHHLILGIQSRQGQTIQSRVRLNRESRPGEILKRNVELLLEPPFGT